jgi:hypothetical protein
VGLTSVELLGGNAMTDLAGVLAYKAPFLIEKLLNNYIVDSEEEGDIIFDEVKKYMILVRFDKLADWQMYSLRVDEVWHQFILFTKEYIDFCELFFGGYVGHRPSNAPRPKVARSRIGNPAKISSFEGFRTRYEEFFGGPLPDVWYDEKSITTRRRVFNHSVGTWTLRGDGGMVDILNVKGDVLLSVNNLARSALVFIGKTGAFYVRELPGDLTDEEKVALIAALVEYRLLRVAA